MSHTYEKLSGNKAKLTFAIPAEQFDEAMQKAFLKNRGRINVPGFRRGKAPRRMIETLYGEGIFYDDAFEILFPEAYEAAVKEFDLHPVDQPEISLDQIGSGQELQFHLEVFVRPDVTLGEYKGLEVEVEKQTLKDEAVDARIAEDQEKASRTIDVDDRPVQNGDTVNLDYAGTCEGIAFDGGTAQGQTLVIGSHSFIEGFEEQMIGMNIGEEKDLNVTFPAEYHAENLKGKPAVFHVKVNGIQTVEKPELDDDFAADVSDFDTFAEYKADIVRQLTERVNKNNDIAVENALVEKAVDNATVDIPKAMIDDQADYMVREMGMRMSYQGIRMEDFLKYTGQTMEQLKAQYMGQAERRVKTELVLEAIKNAEKVEPDEEDVEAVIAEQAENYGQSVEDFKKNLSEEQRNYLKDTAAIQKTVELMKKDAKVTEKKAEETEEKPAKKPAAKKATAKKSAAGKTGEKAETEEAPAAEEKKKAPRKAAAKKTAAKEEETKE